MAQGRFISVEGGEGVGKSTFCRLLCENFKKIRRPIHATREPGGSPMADRIRQLFVSPSKDDPITPLGELYLISAARTQHVQHKILPELQNGVWVLCDRFADSTRVYQGELGGLSRAMIESVIETSTQKLSPDMTFILDCPAEVALARIKAADSQSQERNGASRYDDAALATHQKMRDAFRTLANQFPDRIRLLDASKEVHEVVAQAWEQLRLKFAGELA